MILLKNNLEQLRAEKSISQVELADAMEVSRQTISSLENGRYNPASVQQAIFQKKAEELRKSITLDDLK